MADLPKTYESWLDLKEKRAQTEYTQETPLLADDGTLLVSGWARRDRFTYDRTKTKPQMRAKEWDFYQMTDGEKLLQISFANISIGGYCSACLKDLTTGAKKESMSLFLGGKNKYVLPAKGDVPNRFEYNKGKFSAVFDTHEDFRTLTFKGICDGKTLECNVRMDIPEGLENITTVLPFKGYPTRYFMTIKQNCMPTQAEVKLDGKTIATFDKEKTFAVLDWGRVCTPYKLVWYWGNGATRVKDAEGKEHLFGFEITWGIGDEAHGTETCLFYDGKAQKIGSVDVKRFPKGRYTEPWEFVSDDGRFNLTMTPTFDNFNDTNALLLRMCAHQVYGKFNGYVILDDGTRLEIKDMFAFCEYVENRW